ncbi:hypothetical protein IRI77_30135 [Paludibaculum fermentans]|uniref:Uncharacterized protein n=2 Tax=Paludibaculum fermentans TaxID=1473598 RepID=A0A7S7SJ99_PALFE|nr:hypothetical protein IRI77_30135 [Paludibaculum fermentans]
MAIQNLSFLVAALNPPEQLELAVVPVIDGLLLADLVTEFEARFGYQPAGGYGGVVFAFGSIDPLDNFLGISSETFLLGCDCGELGCWPLCCCVRHEGEMTEWTNFSQPHRPDRDYSAFGPFRFEGRQYREAISSLSAQLASSRP